MDTIAIWIAGGAIGLAIVLGIVKALRPKASQFAESNDSFGIDSVAGAAMGAPISEQRRRNKRGWNAPSNHWFDDDGHLHDDTGNLIMDMLIIAELCGVIDMIPGIGPDGQDYIPGSNYVEQAGDVDKVEKDLDISSGSGTVGTETIAKPEPVVTPTPEVEPIAASPAPEPAKFDGGGYGGGGYDGGDSDSDSDSGGD